MFQILKEPKFDFMRHSRPALIVATALVVLASAVLAINGLNLGIEFTGGTELQLKYRERPDVAEIRSALDASGLRGATVTTIGDPEEHEVYVRLATAADPDEEQDLTGQVTSALRGDGQRQGIDINLADAASLAARLREAPGVTADRASELARRIVDARRDAAIFHSLDELGGVEGMDQAALEHLRQAGSYAGVLSVRSQSYIGPAVGRELMDKAILAIIGSLIGMLIYIAFRFQLVWGFAAVIALFHDTMVTLGLFSLFGKEMSLPVVAAFLTLVGYSVNDTVVVFDRIRENINARGAGDLVGTINLSINQTLSRTVITSGLTWVVVCGLLVFGGAALNPFSFVLTIGVVVGTFSSIYVASPALLLVRQALDRRKAAAARAGARRARKVRSGSSAGGA